MCEAPPRRGKRLHRCGRFGLNDHHASLTRHIECDRYGPQQLATPCEFRMITPRKTLGLPSLRVCTEGGRYFGLAMGKYGFGLLWKVGRASEFVRLPLQGAV